MDVTGPGRAREIAPVREQDVPGPGRAPEDAPVAEAIGHRRAAVWAQADERVLTGHERLVGIDGGRHAVSLLAEHDREPRGDVGDLFRADAMRHGVLVP